MNDATMPGWVLSVAIVLFLLSVAVAAVYGLSGDAAGWPDEEPTEEFE